MECQIDDILVFGDTHEKDDQRLEAVSKTIKGNGVTLNTEKCKFAKKKIQFLAHLISEGGVEADPSKVEAITQMETPAKLTELRRFLGLASTYPT